MVLTEYMKMDMARLAKFAAEAPEAPVSKPKEEPKKKVKK